MPCKPLPPPARNMGVKLIWTAKTVKGFICSLSNFNIRHLAQWITWGSVFNILYCKYCLCLRKNNICCCSTKDQPQNLFILSGCLNNVNSIFALISKEYCEFRDNIVLLSKATIKLLKVTIIDCTPKCFRFLFVSLSSAMMFSEN